MCAQSLFKLHPRFDAAVKGVLEASASNHIVFTAGRRPPWTADFKKRLGLTLGDVLMQKVKKTICATLGKTRSSTGMCTAVASSAAVGGGGGGGVGVGGLGVDAVVVLLLHERTSARR